MIILKPLQNLQYYLQIKKNLELLTQNNLYNLLNLIEEENFKIKGINLPTLHRPPSLYLANRRSWNRANNYELTPSLLEMYEIKYGLLISQELSYFLQHKFPQKAEYNFKFSDFIPHFLDYFNNLANTKQKTYKYNKNEIMVSAEILTDLPDVIKGDCERLEEILGFLLLPMIKKFADLVRISITCEFPENVENNPNECKFLFILEITRKNDDDELEKFLRTQIFAYAKKNQQEIYELIIKNLKNEELFMTGLNLLPFLLKVLDNEYFDISSYEFVTTIKFFIPFFLEPQRNKSPSNFLKYNEINLDCFYHIVASKRKKLNDKEYIIYRAEKKSQRSFEELGFDRNNKLILEPSSSDSVKGSAKSSPLKKNKNHKILREDLLKMVSPESSYQSSNMEANANREHCRKQSLPVALTHKKELKICSKIIQFNKFSDNIEEIEFKQSTSRKMQESSKIMQCMKPLMKKPESLHEMISMQIDNYMEILQEKYKETLEKTIYECLKLKDNITLNEIHEELFNLIVEENKFKFMNKRKERKEVSLVKNNQSWCQPIQKPKKKTLSHNSLLNLKKEIKELNIGIFNLKIKL